MPEAVVAAEVTTKHPAQIKRGAASDVAVLTGENHPELVIAREQKKAKDAPKIDSPEDKAKAELAAIEKEKAAKKAAEAEEEIDHPDEEKKGKLNERFSDLTAKRKAAEAKAEAEGKRAKELSERAEAAERRAQELADKYEPKKGDDIGPEPQPEQFSDTKEFAKALKDWTQESVRIEDAKKSNAARAEKEHAERMALWKDGEAALRLEAPDYDKRLSDSGVVLSDQARDAVVDEGALGPRILLHLADNPEVAEALGKLPVGRMLKKMGEIAAEVRKTVKAEAKAEAKADAKAAGTHSAAEISRAPAPISPLNGGNAEAAVRMAGSNEFHGTFEDYKAARRAGRIK